MSEESKPVEYEVLTLEEQGLVEEENPSKTGPKKNLTKLVAVEAMGYAVGRGITRNVVNPDDVYKLAAMGCTTMDIARWFSITEQTVRYNFSEVIEKGREEMKQSLRMAMIKNAMGGNAALQIFLAKNWLGMSDQGMNSGDNEPLPWNEDEE